MPLKDTSPSAAVKIKPLIDFIRKHPKLFVITGAGISTGSGIPDYRDRNGIWKRQPPIMHQDFVKSESVRKRYWARSLIGWRFFGRAQPNASHRALADLESGGYVQQLVTQNVDGLHQRAGSQRVINLHGCIDTIRCLSCSRNDPRSVFQSRLEQENPHYSSLAATVAPDGDADLEELDFKDFIVPSCIDCNGAYMPKVVFYGGSVPKGRIEQAYSHLEKSNAVLVLGSSLMVYSAYQFCRHASRANIPVVAINQGRTRHDGNYNIKLDQPCDLALKQISNQLLGDPERHYTR